MPSPKKLQPKDKKSPVIFYKWKGIDCIRSRGYTGRQATVAKKQAGILGKASALSARIREAFKFLLPSPLPKEALFHFNNILQQWIRSGQSEETTPLDNVPYISNYTFGRGTTDEFFHNFLVERDAEGNCSFIIPAFNNGEPGGPNLSTTNLQLHIVIASCNLTNATDTVSAEHKEEINYTDDHFPGHAISLPKLTKPGCITLFAFTMNNRIVRIAAAMYN